MNTEFTLYALDAGLYGGVRSEHTYVQTSDGANFNCFGRSSGGRFVRKSNGSSKWARLIYGQYEGCGEDQPAAGLRVRYDGVCQNAANRLLVTTGDAIDARTTGGNVLTTLMYGMFGFNLDKYIDTVKSTGDQLLQSDPGEIQQADIDAVLDRIKAGQTPDAELDLLHMDLQDLEKVTLPDITEDQLVAFRPIYSDYQKEREQAFLDVVGTVHYGDQIAWKLLPDRLRQPLLKCLHDLVASVGLDEFKKMFGIDPNNLVDKIFPQ
jgi:hypothetical protein